MSKKNWSALSLLGVVCCLVLVGCGDSANNETAENAVAPEGASSADAESAVADNSPETDAEYLPAPEGNLSGPYMAAQSMDDANGLLQLAGVSLQHGMQLAKSGDESGYDYLAQAAQVLRKAKAAGAEVPSQMCALAFYKEACGLSLKGDVESGLAALEEAIRCGFDDKNLLNTDTDIAALRKTERFTEMMESMDEIIAAAAAEEAKAQLASAETFDFDFALTDFNGEEQSLEKLKGKVLIVDIWGTWCPPCRAEIPSFVKLQETYGDQGFQMIGLNYERVAKDKVAETVLSFMEENGINYPCAPGTDEIKDQVPGFRGFPTTLFIDHTGKVRMSAVGLHRYGYLEAIVKTLLEEKDA
ncbi:MAG: TlpA disulfide reductase family protein [Planctomycetota bacterium]